MLELKTDSRKVKQGDTFIAIRGVEQDGHDYILDAILNGATKIICEEGDFEVETEVVPDTKVYLEEYLYKNVYPKFSDMKCIGVTGTNGKGTVCYLVYQMLNQLGVKCAHIGTIGFFYPGGMRELNNTTPAVDLLYEMFLEAKEAGCKVVVMEVSSHALSFERIFGIEYDEVAFTNLTQDHLDYHKTMENYADAKRKLFTKTRGDKKAIINADDTYHRHFMLDENNNMTFGFHSNHLRIEAIQLSHLGTTFSFSIGGKTYETSIPMVGKFNVYNYLTAFLLVKNLGFTVEEILAINEKLEPSKGRMELIPYGTNSVFVDYAHTPDAVENVLKSAQEYKKGRMITIVGCGGNRDALKRPIMGQIAEENSDFVLYTSDNPRCEDPQVILNAILKGVKKENHKVIIDRKEAILEGMGMLRENDILMVLGKGHEDYQIIGHEKQHFSDQEVVMGYIKENPIK